jgi:O-antigen/teichoic acid export membrane protein
VSAQTVPSGALPEPKRLRTDVFLMAATKVLVLVLGVVTSVILARALGPSDRGTLAVAYNLALVLVQLGSLGLATANPYFAVREPDAIGRLVVNALWLAALGGCLLVAAAAAMRVLLPGALPGVTWPMLVVAGAGVPLALAAAFVQSILLGLGRTVAYNLVEAVTAVAGVAFLVVGFVVLDIGVVGALALLGAQQLLALAWYIALLRPHISTGRWPDMQLLRRMTGYGFRIYVATLLAYLVIRVDMFLVNGTLGAAEAGRYAVAVALADGMVLLPTVVAVNLFPRIARGASEQTTAEVFRSVGLLFALLCLVSVPLAGPAIRALYGPAFHEATTLYLWLLPGIFCLGMLTILSHHFAGRGFPLEAMLVWFVGLAANIAINVLFLHHGTYVAALASSVAYALLLALHVWMLARETGLRPLVPHVGDAIRMVRGALQRSPT